MKRNTVIYIFILIIALSTAGILTYLNVKKPYDLKNENAKEAGSAGSLMTYQILPEDIKAINSILDSIDASEYEIEAENYFQELKKLGLYKTVLLKADFLNGGDDKVSFDGTIYKKDYLLAIYDEYDLDIDEAEKKLGIYEAIYESLSYAATYRKDIQKIIKRASRLMSVSLFSQSQKDAISGKGSEYFKNGDIEIKAWDRVRGLLLNDTEPDHILSYVENYAKLIKKSKNK